MESEEEKENKMKKNKMKNSPDTPEMRALKANFFKTFRQKTVPNKRKYGKKDRRQNKVQ